MGLPLACVVKLANDCGLDTVAIKRPVVARVWCEVNWTAQQMDCQPLRAVSIERVSLTGSAREGEWVGRVGRSDEASAEL